MVKIGRNDPCWCGSGKKYKQCHLNMSNETKTDIQEIIKKHKKAFGKRYCIFPDTSKCKGHIVKAHTIQRNGSLTKIARDGHLYRITFPLSNLNNPEAEMVAELEGIRKISTFTGFCQHHDTEIFKPVENKPFTSTNEQCLLLAFRIIAKELYLKRAAKENSEMLWRLIKEGDVGAQQSVEGFSGGTDRACTTLELVFEEYFEKYRSKDFSDIRYATFYLDAVPEVMFSGGVFPEFDYKGNILQDLSDSDLKADVLTYSSFATDSGGAIVFSWLKSSDYNCVKFIDSLLTLDADEIPDAIARLCFEYCENTAISPEWWDNIGRKKQDAIINRFSKSVTPMTERDNNCLGKDGFKYVDWNIKDIKTKLE